SHYYLVSFLEGSCHHRPLHSFPTRRSSDLSLRFCCTTELRSKAFSCVTATCTGCMVGGSMRGRITLTSNTTHTSTARNSGSNPFFRSFLRLALPLGRCQACARRADVERSGSGP